MVKITNEEEQEKALADAFICLLGSTKLMRKFQKEYFETRNKELLIKAKNEEQKVDAFLLIIERILIGTTMEE